MELRKLNEELRAEVCDDVNRLCDISCKGIKGAVKNTCGVRTKVKGKGVTASWRVKLEEEIKRKKGEREKQSTKR